MRTGTTKMASSVCCGSVRVGTRGVDGQRVFICAGGVQVPFDGLDFIVESFAEADSRKFCEEKTSEAEFYKTRLADSTVFLHMVKSAANSRHEGKTVLARCYDGHGCLEVSDNRATVSVDYVWNDDSHVVLKLGPDDTHCLLEALEQFVESWIEAA